MIHTSDLIKISGNDRLLSCGHELGMTPKSETAPQFRLSSTGSQVGAGPIFSGHVQVNQWSDFFWRGLFFFRTSIMEYLVVILETMLSPQHMFFAVILMRNTTFNAHNN